METAFPQLLGLAGTTTSKSHLLLGGQNFTQCCMLAMNQSLWVLDGNVIGTQTPSYIVGDWTDLTDGYMPCGATYSGILLALKECCVPNSGGLLAYRNSRSNKCHNQHSLQLVLDALWWVATFPNFRL